MRYEKINPKLLKVTITPGEKVFARRGSMLGYTGQVTFAPTMTAGQGVGGVLGRVVAGESAPLMECEGAGEVLYGHMGLVVQIIELNGAEQLCVEADRLLAYDGNLQPGTLFLGSQGGIKGVVRGAVSGQGLFTTTLAGTGQVAVLAHGGTIELPITPDKPVHVDPQAYVAHKGNVTNELASSVGLRDLVGRGSGEAFQLKLSGSGTVYVQASERKF